jgi:hypothetical protein
MNCELIFRRGPRSRSRAPREGQRGLAILLVLMVLLALLILVGPFLWTAGEADAAGARLTDQSTLRLALDDAGRHARSQLVGSHPSVDPSRASDGLEELAVSIGLEPSFYDHADAEGVMWDHEVADLAGRVDLTTASPQLLANLMGRASYLSRALPSDADEVRVASADGFPEAGLLWIGGELIEYRTREGAAFKELDRGVLGGAACGPRNVASHPAGAPVISLDAWAVAWWRASRGMQPAAGASVDDLVGEIRAFLPTPLPGASISAEDLEDPEAWAAALEEGLAEALDQTQPEDPFQAFSSVLDRHTTLFGGVAAEDLWSRPVRLLNDVTGCTLQVEQWRFFNTGSTVLLEGDGAREVHLVRSANNGTIQLENEVQGTFRGLESQVRVLARRPVNVNTARPEVLRALVQNVGLVGRNERISRQEAEALVAEIVAKRPFDHMEDFLRRLVAPAAGITVAGQSESLEDAARRTADLDAAAPAISIEDAVALYRNALNANDSALSFSTAPFSFVSRDLYELDLRAQLHAPSGVPRGHARRRQIEWLAPPGDLIHVVATQADFDEALRLRRNAPGYRTTPERTHIDDVTRGASPPSRIAAHLPLTADNTGALLPVTRPVFPGYDEFGTVRAAPIREQEVGQRVGRMLHFDSSTNDLEGFDLSEEALQLDPGSNRVQWLANGYLRPFNFSGWFKPSVNLGTVFDIGSADQGDRVHLSLAAGGLTLRVFDGPGDHPATPFEEVAQIELPLTELWPADLWSHVEVDVRGNRPDQIGLRVDGFGFAGEGQSSAQAIRGLTHLSVGLTGGDTQIGVRSTAGFPAECLLRIGEEVIEAVVSGPTTFDATRQLTGPLAGFGGRLSRENASWQISGAALLDAGALTKDQSYPAGTPVRLCGYSTPISSNVPPSAGSLTSDVGPFAVGRLTAVDGQPGEEIAIEIPFPPPLGVIQLVLGRGFQSQLDQPQSIDLINVDPGQSPQQVMEAFHTGGGYAAIVQVRVPFVRATADGGTAESEQFPMSTDGIQMGGVEVVHYSGWQGSTLQIDQWGIDAGLFPQLQAVSQSAGQLGGGKAFVVEWTDNLIEAGSQTPLQQILSWQAVCVPISVPCGANANAFLPPQNGESEFAQLTEVDAAELTEWIRYDHIDTSRGDLVRVDDAALEALYEAVSFGAGASVQGNIGDPDGDDDDGGGGPPFGDPGTPGGSGPATPPAIFLGPDATPPAPKWFSVHPSLPAPSAVQDTAYWNPEIGTAEDENFAYTRAISDSFQFRGVLGTHAHAHDAGINVTPVFRTRDTGGNNPQFGWPGRRDAAFLVDAGAQSPGFPVRVHRAYRPSNRVRTSWDRDPANLIQPLPGNTITLAEQGFPLNFFYVALEEAVGVPFGPGAATNGGDMREVTRLTLFHSGELPRLVDQLNLGQDRNGGERLNAVMDEVVFGATNFGGGYTQGFDDFGCQLILAQPLGPADTQIFVFPNIVRLSRGDVSLPPGVSAADDLPEDGGLLKFGDEFILYTGVDAVSGVIDVAQGGRGALLTEPHAHAVGEGLSFWSGVEVSNLAGGLGPEDGAVALTDADGFPPHATLFINGELLHTDYLAGNLLLGPRRSEEPGAFDGEGEALLRGRYGSIPGAHAAGDAVVLWPARYWDRWNDRADAPELHYFGGELSQPDAFVRSAFFDFRPGSTGQVNFVALQRTDDQVPWDADPRETPGLDLIRPEDLDDDGRFPIARQTSRVEWRFAAEYQPLSFDALTGLSHGWKTTPELNYYGAEYWAPSRVLERVQR